VALSLKSGIMPFGGLGIAAVLALVGCSAPSGDTDAPGAASGETRVVTDVAGEEVEIPVDPQRVVALDEPSALNLLAIGITPEFAFQGWKTVVPAELLSSRGIEVLTTADFYAELEEVAALEPDLVVISTNPARVGEVPDYASIAPTLRVLFNASPAELAQIWGEYFDQPERAQASEEGLAEFAAEIASEQPEPALSLSALESYGPSDSPFYMDGASSLHSVIADAGFDRPELQDAESADGGEYGGSAPFSPETLPDHDADIIAIKSSTMFTPEGITGLPLFSSLGAAESGQVVEVDGDFWSGARCSTPTGCWPTCTSSWTANSWPAGRMTLRSAGRHSSR
jgi:iron complex transport system substrate-binding protein